MLLMPRPRKDSSKEIENIGGAKHHCVKQREPNHKNLLLSSLAMRLGAIELNLTNLTNSPRISRKPSNRHLLIINTDEIPCLESIVASPGHGDWSIGIGEVERAVGVDGLPALLC